MFKKFFFTILFTSSFLFAKESVVCIHGFLGSPWNMHFIGRNLQKEGWDVIKWGYQSRDACIEDHGKNLIEKLLELSEKTPGEPIHFVCHSMGSLVLLSALNHPDCPEEAKRGKVVLIAPPLKGSKWAQWLGKFSFARWLLKGFSGHELMTKTDFKNLGEFPESHEKILVIAGNLGFNPILRGENDGTLLVDETVLSIPHERAVIRRGHKSIIFSKKAYLLIHKFFQKQE